MTYFTSQDGAEHRARIIANNTGRRVYVRAITSGKHRGQFATQRRVSSMVDVVAIVKPKPLGKGHDMKLTAADIDAFRAMYLPAR